jgi:Putative DNA-binding domain
MVNLVDLSEMTKWTDSDLLSVLPAAENAEFEYKSSLTPDDAMAFKIKKAASGFWNSGGGYLVLGIDNKSGKPDGGITTIVGRQSRRDWIDRQVSSVAPKYPNGYGVHEITSGGAGLLIHPGKAVYVVGFAESETAPHMADDKYFVRAGAHTEPASAFIVEALMARRGNRQRQLRLSFRHEPTWGIMVQIGVFNVSSVSAIDVEVEFKHPPKRVLDDVRFARTHLIDRDTPFFIDYVATTNVASDQFDKNLIEAANTIKVRYKNMQLTEFIMEETVTLQTTSVAFNSNSSIDRIDSSLRKISEAVSIIASSMRL